MYPTDTQDSEGLWRVLQPLLATFKRVLIVRGQSGREWLGDRFQQAGIHVDRLALYDRQAAVWDAQQSDKLAAALAEPAPCVFLLTSAEGVESEIGRASGRERVCQDVEIWVVAVPVKKKKTIK